MKSNIIKISTFCSEIFFLLVYTVLSGIPACRKCHGALSYLSAAASQPSPIKGWGTESSEPGGTELTTTSLSKGHRSTNDRRTKPEIAGKLYGYITVERCDGQPVPKSDYTPASKRGQGRMLACGHPTPRRRWASEVEPLLVGVEPLPRAWHWLAGASVAVPPGITVLTHLSGNWHRSLLIVTICTYARRSIPDTAYTSASPLNKFSTAASCWLFFLPAQYYLFIFLGYPTHLCSPLKHSRTTRREQNCYFQQIIKDWRAFSPIKVYVA